MSALEQGEGFATVEKIAVSSLGVRLDIGEYNEDMTNEKDEPSRDVWELKRQGARFCA